MEVIKSSRICYAILLTIQTCQASAQPITGSIVSWGEPGYLTNVPTDVTNAKEVTCSLGACAILTHDGNVKAWGSTDYGGVTGSVDVTNVSQLTCGYFACAAVKYDGSAVAWGNIHHGGTATVGLTDAIQVTCNRDACAVLKRDGSVGVWGQSYGGGDLQGKDVTNVSQIGGGQSVFYALKHDGSAVVWGHNGFGANVLSDGATNIKQISCGQYTCAALKIDGTVVASGNPTLGGDLQGKDVTNVNFISCGRSACVALRNDHTIVAWGQDGNGGNAPVLTDIIQTSCGGFMSNQCWALKSDGDYVFWGDSPGLPDPSIEDRTKWAKVSECGSNSCAALRKDGSVVAWGDAGGKVAGHDLTNVAQVVCGAFLCAAIHGSDSAGGGGDPHFIGFGSIIFTWQGHCDAILVKTPKESTDGSHLELHIRTTRIRKWSKIDAIAFQVGKYVGEINSNNGELILDGGNFDAAQTKSLVVTKSKIKTKIVLYKFTFLKDKELEVKVNTRTQMIYLKLSGNYPESTAGILGSPLHPGLISRNGTNMTGGNVNTFVESWQVKDSDPQLFLTSRAPQFPSKCWYDMKQLKSNPSKRRLKEVHTVKMEEAVAACAFHPPGPLKNFCIDDVQMTGDIDSANDEFYG